MTPNDIPKVLANEFGCPLFWLSIMVICSIFAEFGTKLGQS